MKNNKNNATVNAETKKVEATQAPIVEQEKKAPEATQEAAQAEETQQENPAPVEGQEQLPAAVSEVKKKGLFHFKTKEEKEIERAEKLAKIDALRADGHRVKAAAADLGLAVGDAAKGVAKVTVGLVAIGGVVAGAVALANRNKEESENHTDESDDNIIDDHVDDTTDEVTSEESEATES